MFKLLKEYRFYVSLISLILLPILAMNINTHQKSEYGFLDKIVITFTAPVQEVIAFTIDRTGRFIQNYVFLLKLHKDYTEIVEENRKLNNTIHNFNEMEAENRRLRALLQFQEKIDEAKVIAQVIAKDVSAEFKSVRINKGSKGGISKGMPIVTHEGVVGRVLRATPDYSDVITLQDELSAVDSLVQRSRAHGLLEGTGDAPSLLKHVLRTDDIEVGDTIVTSGLDGIYPKGLLLGTVTKVTKKSYGISQDVEVKSSVDFSKLEEVLVIIKQDRHIL